MMTKNARSIQTDITEPPLSGQMDSPAGEERGVVLLDGGDFRIGNGFLEKGDRSKVYRETISFVTDSKVTACEGQNDTGDCRCYKYDHVGWHVSREKCDAKAGRYGQTYPENAYPWF